MPRLSHDPAVRAANTIDDVGRHGVRHPDLLAVEPIAEAVERDARLLIAASVPACSSDSANAPMTRPEASGRSQRSFCSSDAEGEDRLGDERVVDREDDGQRRARARERFDRERRSVDVVEAGAAPLRRDRHPHQPELAAARDEVARKLVRLVDGLRHGGDLHLGETRDVIEERLLGGGECRRSMRYKGRSTKYEVRSTKV